jgi:phosphate-selective porin OprO and OprP
VNKLLGRLAGQGIVAGVGCWLLGAATTWAQAPGQEPTTGAAPPTAREAQLEQRILQLESMVRQLQYQSPPGTEGAWGMSPSEPGTTPTPGAVEAGNLPRQSVSQTGGLGVPGQSLPPVPQPLNRFNAPATLEDKSAKVRFGPGFEIATDDDEFIFQFHDLTQLDYRGYLQGGQTTVHDTFGLPRQWWMFSGHITKEVGYFVSLAQGFDAINGLDMFVDFNYDRRLQFRAGRFKTPFTYEFFVEPIQGLITPERSLFFNNFGQNRDAGIMAYGQLFNGPNFDGVSKFQYAAGIFNAARNGYIASQDGKAFSGFINFHPFGDSTDSLLENFNIGGSVFATNNAQASQPATFRTVVPTTGNALLGVPFLTLNNTFREQGPMAFWDMHVAYFYRQLALIGEWQSGYQDYAQFATQAEATRHIRVPVGSFYVLASYLLTGETRSQIGIVKPNRPFSLRQGEFGPGAWELFARYDYMDIGSSIYDYGLASTTGNANRLWMTDIGVNWHMTQYVKMYFDWNHAEFNNPVTYAPGKTQPTSNSLWWRLQLFF